MHMSLYVVNIHAHMPDHTYTYALRIGIGNAYVYVCECTFVLNTCTCAFLKAVHICMYLTVSDCFLAFTYIHMCIQFVLFLLGQIGSSSRAHDHQTPPAAAPAPAAAAPSTSAASSSSPSSTEINRSVSELSSFPPSAASAGCAAR